MHVFMLYKRLIEITEQIEIRIQKSEIIWKCTYQCILLYTPILPYELGHSISYKIACAPSEDSDQPAHPRRPIWVFPERSRSSQESKAPSDGQQRLSSASVNVQTDLSLRWAHMQIL